MAESNPRSGKVTSLGSLFPPEEAEKASKRVQEAISERGEELDRVRGFAAENSALIKLVRQLPDRTSHEIMVPFGSAAFFPGRLIHTNEFLVLLGDGYYADRSSKQTVDILKRREKSLEGQLEALKASMMDLETEAKFFDSTAAEAKEGLVEIREEYVEYPQINESVSGAPDSSSISSSTVDMTNILDKDEEYARMMARLDELEKEELEAGNDEDEDSEDDDAEDGSAGSDELENEGIESEDEDALADFSSSKNYINDAEIGNTENRKPKDTELKPRAQESFHSTASGLAIGSSRQQLLKQSSILDLNLQLKAKDGSSRSNMEQPHIMHKPPLPPEPKDDPRSFAVTKLEDFSENKAVLSGNRDHKAVIGSVIEHTHGLPSNQTTKSTTPDQSSRPVSRFKMQKGNR
ncbi:putative RNA polymerase II subunit 5-mediating protein-like protein [Iris pallida]|uniref:RNA polymerase II subunit 5-mediating protein-like protein n=1 Tax=Iris pallida TaxID=29817 RepID=A0AAX6HP78_IRIPA|nr:putative RNA polymerase II subunit 5-mediating protein-like protein [Iris pallida]